jgi:2-dehydropantoate 2-reductase
MRIGIIGAGAIGGWVAARLAAAGEPVSLLARGATAEALGGGLELIEQGSSTIARPRVSTTAEELGEQDLLVSRQGASPCRRARAAAPMIGPGK